MNFSALTANTFHSDDFRYVIEFNQASEKYELNESGKFVKDFFTYDEVCSWASQYDKGEVFSR